MQILHISFSLSCMCYEKMKVLLITFLIFCITSSSLRIDNGQTHLNVLDYGAVGDGRTDDTQAFIKAWGALCGATSTGEPVLLIPTGKTFLLQPLKFQGPCNSNNVHIQVLGDIVAPSSIGAWAEWPSGCWLCFLEVNGLIIDGSGQINGQGAAWWKQTAEFSNVNKNKCNTPTALGFHNCNNLQLSGLTHLNSPRAHISINHCNGVALSNLHIVAPQDSPNTDGIDISESTQVHIHDSFIGTGDDCIAINGGSSYINITNIVCGPGHGISVGSLGKDGAYETVEEVYVRNCSFNGTQNGARIKTWKGGRGFATKITFEQITLIATKNPIIIDQHYEDGQHIHGNEAAAVKVSSVTYSGIHGTSDSETAIALDCDSIGCSYITMDQINITASVPGKVVNASCKNAQGSSRSTIPIVPCLSNSSILV